MTTFDLSAVREFTADLAAQMDRCDNGEGMECATLDGALYHYGEFCFTLSYEIRRWGLEVFAGRVEFDPEVENLWREKGRRVYSRALQMRAIGEKAEVPCYSLDGQRFLEAALWDLHRLLKGWVTPKRAVGPSARLGLDLDPAAAEEAKRRIDSLPHLPADWQPDEQGQREMYRKLRTT